MKSIHKIFLTFCLVALLATSCEKVKNEPIPEPPKEVIMPPFLKQGDTVAIVSPAYYLSDESIEKGMEVIRSWGYTPIKSPNLGKVHLGKFGGNEEQRTADLCWAYQSPEIKAIMPVRGGYGCIQLLDRIPQNLFASNPKWVIGYSDISTLHMASVAQGVMSLHADMVSNIASSGGKNDDDQLLRRTLSGELPSYEWPSPQLNKVGNASGILVGGNLATINPLIGSPFDGTDIGKDVILFIEDIGEPARNLDRMLQSMVLRGTLDRVRGILVGTFYGCSDEFNVGSIEKMLSDYTLSGVNIPIAYGFKAGHDGTNWPLIEGAQCTLSVDHYEARLKFVK